MAGTGPWLIPPTVYVGDRARLIVPLAWFPQGGGTPETVSAPAAPAAGGGEDIVIHRAELERWDGEWALVVEFTPYATGLLELPPVEAEGLLYGGLRAEIASVLDADSGGGPRAALSGLASPLAVPGTSFFVYGILGGIIAALIAVAGGRLWVRHHLKALLLGWKRRRLIFSMGRIGRRLEKALGEGDRSPDSLRERLDYLCCEFRSFLGLFTLRHCQSMTAGELGEIPALTGPAWPGDPAPGGVFLGPFFRRCDDLRYGGGGITEGDLREMLEKLRSFLDALGRAERAGALNLGEAAAPGKEDPDAGKSAAGAGS
jgi:hypothetical protein